uniref:Uncharacterized protein n=1 Tax=Rhizophora mucronata TaxID=61149 RepID=A0A2P2JBX5_RHIMU
MMSSSKHATCGNAMHENNGKSNDGDDIYLK